MSRVLPALGDAQFDSMTDAFRKWQPRCPNPIGKRRQVETQRRECGGMLADQAFTE